MNMLQNATNERSLVTQMDSRGMSFHECACPSAHIHAKKKARNLSGAGPFA